jgi:hypothetical protein
MRAPSPRSAMDAIGSRNTDAALRSVSKDFGCFVQALW